MGVANRDIKLENVLLVDRKSPPTIKLTDFGFCKSDRDSVPTTICGTLVYMGVRLSWLPLRCVAPFTYDLGPVVAQTIAHLLKCAY